MIISAQNFSKYILVFNVFQTKNSEHFLIIVPFLFFSNNEHTMNLYVNSNLNVLFYKPYMYIQNCIYHNLLKMFVLRIILQNNNGHKLLLHSYYDLKLFNYKIEKQ